MQPLCNLDTVFTSLFLFVFFFFYFLSVILGCIPSSDFAEGAELRVCKLASRSL